jgi:hypothetical protein
MNDTTKIIGTGIVATVVTFLALIFSGLGTTGIADAEGNWITMTTIKRGTTEFGVFMAATVFVSVVAAGYIFNAIDKK